MDMNGPALAPPKGVTPNFENPPNNNALAWGVLITCAVFTSGCFLLRIYARVLLLRKLQTEEILAALGFGAYWGAATATFKMFEKPGYFVHQWNVKLGDVTFVNYWVFIFGVCYSVVLPLLKVAILVEWCRIFVPTGLRKSSPFFWGCVAIMFVQTATGVAVVIALNLQCTPHEAIWDLVKQLTTAKCWDLHQLQLASATIHLVSDIAMIALPQHIIWGLKMAWQKKLGISILFGLGILACVSAAFRLAVTITYGKSADAIYYIGPIGLWGTAEMTCGFFIVCVPCIPKTLKESGTLRKIKRAFGVTTQTTNVNSKDHYMTGSSTRGNRTNTNTTNAYYKLDEEGSIAMKNIQGTESTENLRYPRDPKAANNITRTITVTQDYRSSNGETGPNASAGYWVR